LHRTKGKALGNQLQAPCSKKRSAEKSVNFFALNGKFAASPATGLATGLILSHGLG
jgi:hypothetical protein